MSEPVDPVEQAVRDTVAGLPGVTVLDCDPALADTAEFCRAYGIDPADSANAILVEGRPSGADATPVHVLCVVLATTRLDVNRAVRSRLGVRKASFAPAAVTQQITGMQLGGVTPFGVPAGLPIWVDAAVMQRERIVVGGGSRSAKVQGPPDMLLAIDGVEVVEGLARPAG